VRVRGRVAEMGVGTERGRRLGTLGAAGCLVLATALLVGGCSSVSCGDPCTPGTEPTPNSAFRPTTFSAALAETPTTSWDGTYFEFGDVAQVEQLASGGSKSEFFAYTMVGASSLDESGQQALDTLGFNPLTATSAVTVGNPPHSATVVYGSFDASAIGKKLSAAGFKQHGSADGGTLWAIGDDDKPDPQNPTVDALLNVIDVSSDRIVFSGSTAEVEQIAGPDATPLAKNATLDALANCLGSAKAGLIGPESYPPSQNSTYLGIGLDADSVQNPGEVLCVTAANSSAASGIAANWTQQIEHGRSEQVNEPWSELLTDPQASVISGSSPIVVRLSARAASGAHLGVLLEEYESATTDMSTLIKP
jgi:hypothetical protein